ncbi:hypothetical protein PMIT1320_01211 [Prochlorococcus marinus str. MIT 1320]|nr:hypothetical protein PMIT1320_01211 [Prochlorococcus marinus str. MIT 1320]
MLPEAESTQDPSSFLGNFGDDLYGFLSTARMVQP